MRKVAQLNKDYLAIAIAIILLVVSLIFLVQLSRLRQTQSVASVGLSQATTGEESLIQGPGNQHPQGGGSGQPKAYYPDTDSQEPWDDDADAADKRVSNESSWLLRCALPSRMDLKVSDPAFTSRDSKRGKLLLDSRLLSQSMGAGPSYLHPDCQLSFPGDTLIIRFLPRLALIIDDWGYDWDMAKDFLSLDLAFTAAVLPDRAKTQEQLAMLRQRGHEVILHLPMEPMNPEIELDEECIKTDLSDAEIRRRVESAISAVGRVAGVNNHMGSKATSDERVVRAVLGVVKEHGLYFIDSWTAPTSLAGEAAAEMKIPTATNQAFLDHYDDVERVKRQIERLIRLAKRDGQALGIGHVRPQTYRALVEMIPRFHEEGIVIVPASKVVSTHSSCYE